MSYFGCVIFCWLAAIDFGILAGTLAVYCWLRFAGGKIAGCDMLVGGSYFVSCGCDIFTLNCWLRFVGGILLAAVC